MSQWRLTLLSALLLFFAQAGVAAPIEFQYPDARLIKEDTQNDTWYILALGSITRSRGEWQPEVVERFRGDLVRRSFELPYGLKPAEAHQSYLDILKPVTRRVLFECSGRDCGTSNFWANEVFKVKELYGPDQNQRYTALEINVDGLPVIAAIYSIQRANHRAYLHVDWLEQTHARANKRVSTADLLQSGQAVNLLVTTAGWDVEALDSVAELMRREKDLQLYVVGHAYQGAELAAMQETSRNYAETVSRLLQERGIAADRLSVFGLGPLAPGTRAEDRVVLIRH